jgi:hypothetical protein
MHPAAPARAGKIGRSRQYPNPGNPVIDPRIFPGSRRKEMIDQELVISGGKSIFGVVSALSGTGIFFQQ